MDGFDENKNVIIVGATNIVTNLDPALLRPGRFDFKIEMKLPTPKERAEILDIYLTNKPHNLEPEDLVRAAN